jgi:hypothetical protein
VYYISAGFNTPASFPRRSISFLATRWPAAAFFLNFEGPNLETYDIPAIELLKDLAQLAVEENKECQDPEKTDERPYDY